MINALYEPFPDTVLISGKNCRVVTDFREWLRFADMLGDREIPQKDKLLFMLNWLYEPPDTVNDELVTALCGFYRADGLEPDRHEDEGDEGSETVPRPPVLDWKYDAKYIIGDFLRFYRIDLLNAEMHWWRFRILFSALPDDSQMMKRIAYRGADIGQIKNESERRRILRMQRLFALPFEMDDEDIGAVFGGTM